MLESELDLIDSLVTSFTGKTPLEQVELFRKCVLCYIESKSSKQPNSSESFSERLARESRAHMLKIAKSLDDSELEFTMITVSKLRYAAERAFGIER